MCPFSFSSYFAFLAYGGHGKSQSQGSEANRVISDDGGVPFAPPRGAKTLRRSPRGRPDPPLPLLSGRAVPAPVPRCLASCASCASCAASSCLSRDDATWQQTCQQPFSSTSTSPQRRQDGPHPAESGRAHAVREHVSRARARAGRRHARHARARANDSGWKE